MSKHLRLKTVWEYRETNSTSGVVNGSFFNVVRNYFYDYTYMELIVVYYELILTIYPYPYHNCKN